MAKRQHITPQQFTQMLERAGISPETIKARIRAELTWSQLVRGKFSASLQVGEADVAKALRARNEDDSDAVGYIYTLYPVMVVVPPGSSAGRRGGQAPRGGKPARPLRSAARTACAYARALRDVAVREPITRSSADLAPQLRELLASMPVGHLTPPEVTAQGLQMFALCDKKESKTDSPLKREVRQELFTKRFEAEAKQYLEEIRKQAMIEYKDSNSSK